MKILTLLGVFIFSISALAMNGRTTYQAKIIKPDGYPLEASSVNFRFTVLDTVGSCVLYVEDYTAVNMSQSGGLISFALGNGARSFPASGTSQTFQNTFDNSVTSFSCQTPGIYNPLPTDTRRIVMQFNDGNGWQTLPAMTINTVPYAMYAIKSNDSKTLNGKADTAFVENSTLAALNCNSTTHAITFNGVSFSCIPVGSSSSGITSVTTSGTVLTTGGTASAPVISIKAVTMSQDGYLTSLDYAEFKAKLAASSTQIINTLGYAPVSGAAVATQINNSNLSGDVSGTISSNSVVSVGGKTAAQISTSVNDTLAATSSATADTIVKRNSLGNVTFNDIYANAAKINYVDIYKPSTSFNIRLQAPTSLSTNYVLNLPTTSGTLGQVLSTDGSGNLSWINAATGSVVSVSASAPLASTGGSNPTISITQATSSTNGYLSSTDWNTFNNKQAATSAAIIATLGYTPADNAASGTYLVKASNLSDLTNIPQARSNLGLGGFATVSSLDLGTASATGTLSVGRLPSFIGDATIAAASNTIVLSNSGVTAGTYTKVTVDAKGRVTSGVNLASSDVATALGYTPAASGSVGGAAGSNTQLQFNASGALGATSALTWGGTGCCTWTTTGVQVSGTYANIMLNESGTSYGPSLFFNATAADGTRSAGFYSYNSVLQDQWFAGKGYGSNLFMIGYQSAVGAAPVRNTADPTYAKMVVNSAGNIGIGTAAPSAKLHLSAGTSSTASFKFTSGTLLTSSQAGTMEYDGANFYLTDSTNTRRAIAANANPGTYDNVSNIDSSGNITMTPVGSVVVSSTTASTNSNTGALVVKGGLGVAGNIYTSGTIVTSSNIQGVSVTATSGMISPYIYGSTASGGALTLDSTTHSTKGNVLIAPNGGNVGIGTSNPTRMLDVNGGTAQFALRLFGSGPDAAAVRFENTSASGGRVYHVGSTDLISGAGNGFSIFDATSATTRLLINPNGNVGVGTTTPLSMVPGWTPLSNQKLLSITGDGSASLNTNGILVLANNRATPTAGDQLGAVVFGSQNNSGSIPAYFEGVLSGSGGANGFGGALRFHTKPDNVSAPVERVRISSDGNVGIGTASPNGLLDVRGGVTVGALGKWGVRDNAAGSQFAVEYHNGGAFSDANIRMVVNSSGSMGISTSAPVAKLTVNGSQSGMNDSGIFLINDESYPNDATTGRPGLSFGYDNANDWAWVYSRRAGKAARPYYINGTMMVNPFNGNVGIGTTSLFSTFQVKTGTNQNVGIEGPVGAVSGNTLNVFNDAHSANVPLEIRSSATYLGLLGGSNVGIGTTSPTAKLDVAGAIRAHGQPFPWRWKNTSTGVNFGTSTWVDLTTITVNLPANADVEMKYDGSVFAIESGIHCSLRFVVDGVAVSDNATYGDQIIMGNSTDWWHAVGRSRWVDNMAAGTHTIKVQGSAQPSASAVDKCRVDGTDYSRIRFTIMAYPVQ